MADKPKKEADLARRIWLAGIGAYGKAFNEAQEAYAKMGQETTKVFDDLVGKGTQLENKVSTVAKKYVPEAVQKNQAIIEDRMERMRATLGLASVTSDQQEQIEGVEDRLDAIEEKLDQLLEAVAELKAAKKPAGRKTVRKTPTKKT